MIWSALTSRLGIIGIAALLLIAAVFAYRAADARADLAEERLEAALATVTALSLDLQIAQAASAQRARDDTTITTQRRELSDASTVAGDSPDDRELRRLCVLRAQQSGIDRVPPECRRFDQPARTAAP